MRMLLAAICLTACVLSYDGDTAAERRKQAKSALEKRTAEFEEYKRMMTLLERNDLELLDQMTLHSAMASAAYDDWDYVRGATLMKKDSLSAWYKTFDKPHYFYTLKGFDMNRLVSDAVAISQIVRGELPDRVMEHLKELVSFVYALDLEDPELTFFQGRKVRIKNDKSNDIWEVIRRPRKLKNPNNYSSETGAYDNVRIKNTNKDSFVKEKYDSDEPYDMVAPEKEIKHTDLEFVEEVPVQIYVDGHSLGGFCAAMLVSAIHWKNFLREGPPAAQEACFRHAFHRVKTKIESGKVEISCYGFNTFVWEDGMKDSCAKKLWDFIGDSRHAEPEEVIPTNHRVRYQFYSINTDKLTDCFGDVLGLSEKVKHYANPEKLNGNAKHFHQLRYNRAASCMLLEFKPLDHETKKDKPGEKKMKGDENVFALAMEKMPEIMKLHSIDNFLSPLDYDVFKGTHSNQTKLQEKKKIQYPTKEDKWDSKETKEQAECRQAEEKKEDFRKSLRPVYIGDDWKELSKGFPHLIPAWNPEHSSFFSKTSKEILDMGPLFVSLVPLIAKASEIDPEKIMETMGPMFGCKPTKAQKDSAEKPQPAKRKIKNKIDKLLDLLQSSEVTVDVLEPQARKFKLDRTAAA